MAVVARSDSRNVKTPRGYVQGYNAQAAVTEAQILIAAELTIDSPDFGHLEPMVTETANELAAIGHPDTPQVVVADAGYWHQVQMDNVVERGIQVLIAPDGGKRRGTRPGWDGGLYAFMRRVLQTDGGKALYAKRQGMIEPVFAHTKFNRRMDRRSRATASASNHVHAADLAPGLRRVTQQRPRLATPSAARSGHLESR